MQEKQVSVRRELSTAEASQLSGLSRNHITLLLSRDGLRYNEQTIAAGAQTERRGGAGPVRDLLGGETSPAALFQ